MAVGYDRFDIFGPDEDDDLEPGDPERRQNPDDYYEARTGR